MDLILDASGIPALEFNLLDALARNGTYVVTGIPGGDRPLQIAGAELIRQLVLDNQVMLGSVNAARGHFQMAVDDLAQAQLRWGDSHRRLDHESLCVRPSSRNRSESPRPMPSRKSSSGRRTARARVNPDSTTPETQRGEKCPTLHAVFRNPPRHSRISGSIPSGADMRRSRCGRTGKRRCCVATTNSAFSTCVFMRCFPTRWER